MKHRFAKLAILFLVISAVTAIFSASANAQQITYYTFDTAAGNFSYNSCQDTRLHLNAVNPLLCFNDALTALDSGTGSESVAAAGYLS